MQTNEKVKETSPLNMRKLLLATSALLIVSTFSYLPGSKVIYASRSVITSSILGSGTYGAGAKSVKSGMPRDFKLPDDESENTSYEAGSISVLPGSESDTDIKIIPWKGPKVVVIDPGHGGDEPGAIVGNLIEKEINLDVSLRVHSILKDSGVLTLMTRKEDTFIEPKDRILFANQKGAALFVSIHSNWFRDQSFNGTMTLYYPSRRLSSGYLNEIDYALVIQEELMSQLETSDRGIIDRPNLAVLRHADMPSVLIELGFMSNKSDAALLSSDGFRQRAAEGIAKGIIQSLDKID